MKDFRPYFGKTKDNFDWYDPAQRETMRRHLGDELFEEIDRIEQERKERERDDTQRNS